MSTTLAALLLATFGIVAVLAVSWVFYRIGKAEDRDRAAAASAEREERTAGPETPSNGHRSPGLAQQRRRPRPPRRPG